MTPARSQTVLALAVTLAAISLMGGCGESPEEFRDRIGRELSALQQQADDLERRAANADAFDRRRVELAVGTARERIADIRGRLGSLDLADPQVCNDVEESLSHIQQALESAGDGL